MEDEDEETVLQILRLINVQLSDLKNDVESLKRDHDRLEHCSRQHSCEGPGGEENQETIQRNHFHRLYSFQGSDDLDLCNGKQIKEGIPLILFSNFIGKFIIMNSFHLTVFFFGKYLPFSKLEV